MEQIINQLVERLRKTYGDRLVSAILYGSAATGENQDKFSDINVFCVLQQITPEELGESEPIFRWWREQGNPSPLLMAQNEVSKSTDCFPIEFHDMRERHRVLHGVDVVAGLEIDYKFHRAQVEHELRAKLLRLRQKSAGVLSDNELLMRMMADSVSTFCVLFRHALLLAGAEISWQKREIIVLVKNQFGIDSEPFETLLDIREGKIKPRGSEAKALFARYLREVQTVVDGVDRLERN